MLRRTDIQEVELNMIQSAHIHGEGKLMAPLTMSRISDALTTEGLATKGEAQQILTIDQRFFASLRTTDGVGQARRLEQLQCLRRCIDDLAHRLA